jgi:hypothetical protein
MTGLPAIFPFVLEPCGRSFSRLPFGVDRDTTQNEFSERYQHLGADSVTGGKRLGAGCSRLVPTRGGETVSSMGVIVSPYETNDGAG